MKIRHFALDADGQFRKFRRDKVRELLRGDRVAAGYELRLATAVCDNDLIPTGVFLVRVPLTDGALTPADLLALRAFARPDCVTPAEAVRHHLSGWPSDLIRQLAVALDVPAAEVEGTLDVGGPVFLAAVTGESVARVMRGEK